MGRVEVRGLKSNHEVRHSAAFVLPHFEDVRGLNEKECDARGDAAVHEGLGLMPHPGIGEKGERENVEGWQRGLASERALAGEGRRHGRPRTQRTP